MVAQQRRSMVLVLAIGFCCLAGAIVALVVVSKRPSNASNNAHLDYVTGTVVSVEPAEHALSIHPEAMGSDAPFSEDPIRFVFRNNDELYDSDLGHRVTIGYFHNSVGVEGARDGYCFEFKGLDSPSARDPMLANARDLSSSAVYSCEGTIDSFDAENGVVTLLVDSTSSNAQDLGLVAGSMCSFDLSAWTMRESLTDYSVGDTIGVWFSELTTDDGTYRAWCAQPI